MLEETSKYHEALYEVREGEQELGDSKFSKNRKFKNGLSGAEIHSNILLGCY